MSCDSCNQTNIDCTCPDAEGIAGSRLDNIVSTDTGVTHAINGAGYTMTLYTNSTTGNQRVFVESNMNITADIPHQISTTYLVNGVTTGYSPQLQNLATIKTDHTHFLPGINLAAGDILTINITSSDPTGLLVFLNAFIYKYDY